MHVALRRQSLSARGLGHAYASDVRLFNRWCAGRRLNADTLIAYFAELEQTHRVSSLCRKKAALKRAIVCARGDSLTVAEHAQLSAVFKRIRTGQADCAVYEHEILSRDELSALLDRAGTKTAAIVSALYETAARVSELLSIRVSDCTVRDDTVHCEIRRGKGRKQRTVYMTRRTYETLRECYRGKTYLLEHKRRQLSRHTIMTLVKRAGANIGRGDIHPHTLRHTKASHLLKAGMSLAAVSAYLGHSNAAVTAKYYVHDKPTPEAVLEMYETHKARDRARKSTLRTAHEEAH